MLRKCLDLRPEDGPSLAILHAMESLAQVWNEKFVLVCVPS